MSSDALFTAGIIFSFALAFFLGGSGLYLAITDAGDDPLGDRADGDVPFIPGDMKFPVHNAGDTK